MTEFFGYVRVSTAKQGEKGVSLQEQRDAILRYAQRNELKISDWFEERVTAAKRGRPIFTRMLRLLKQGRADGIIIHKIDRSAWKVEAKLNTIHGVKDAMVEVVWDDPGIRARCQRQLTFSSVCCDFFLKTPAILQ